MWIYPALFLSVDVMLCLEATAVKMCLICGQLEQPLGTTLLKYANLVSHDRPYSSCHSHGSHPWTFSSISQKLSFVAFLYGLLCEVWTLNLKVQTPLWKKNIQYNWL